MIEDRDLANGQPVAVAVVLHPTAGVLQGHVFHEHVAAAGQVDRLGAQLGLVPERLALPVDRPLARDGDVLEIRARQDGRIGKGSRLALPD